MIVSSHSFPQAKANMKVESTKLLLTRINTFTCHQGENFVDSCYAVTIKEKFIEMIYKLSFDMKTGTKCHIFEKIYWNIFHVLF